MADNYPNATFRPTQLARDMVAEQGLTIQDAIDVIQSPGSSWNGSKPNQRWHRGETKKGVPIRVLIEDSGVGIVWIITVRDIQGGD
jgi:hypothetical protein